MKFLRFLRTFSLPNWAVYCFSQFWALALHSVTFFYYKTNWDRSEVGGANCIWNVSETCFTSPGKLSKFSPKTQGGFADKEVLTCNAGLNCKLHNVLTYSDRFSQRSQWNNWFKKEERREGERKKERERGREEMAWTCSDPWTPAEGHMLMITAPLGDNILKHSLVPFPFSIILPASVAAPY